MDFELLIKNCENIVVFLDNYKALVNSHMTDYFTKSLFNNNLPPEIAKEIISDSESAVNNLLNISTSDLINLNKFMCESKSLILHNMHSVCIVKKKLFDKITGSNSTGCVQNNFNFKGFMTDKKYHEVEILNNIVCLLHKTQNVTHFVDIGDGKGYLSSFVALQNEIPVLGVDFCQVKTHGSIKRVKKLEKNWKGAKKANNSERLYKQVTQFVTEDTDFDKIISENFSEKDCSIGLLGLHTCGDLGATSAKIFVKNPKMSVLCNVSCCYHFLTEVDDNSHDFSFPLSDVLRKKNFKLGRNARMLASQPLEKILHKVEKPKKVNFYRAILQIVLQKYGRSDFTVGRTKSECRSFVEYAKNALKKIDLVVSDEELSLLYKSYESEANNFLSFYLIRCYIAPTIESIILLDRLIYLYENGINEGYLVHLFDPTLSPRCYGLIAIKNVK